jgi:hypothetical protein
MRATLCALALPLLLAGCASQSPLPEVSAYKSPVVSGAKVPGTHHHTTLTGYKHREPVTPDAWVTEDAAPEPSMTDEDCKKTEGADDDCPAQ